VGPEFPCSFVYAFGPSFPDALRALLMDDGGLAGVRYPCGGGIFASEARGGTTMTTMDHNEGLGGVRRQRNTIRRYRRRTIGLSMAALVFGVIYLAATVVFVAVVFLR
jgi:hypothetical protein